MSSNPRREILHLGLGPEACAIAAHAWNLQGLAATNGTCDPIVTHETAHGLWVPRGLLIDGCDDDYHRGNDENVSSYNWEGETSAMAAATWGGRVERVESTAKAAPPAPNDAWQSFFQTATTLAESSYSRYRVPESMQQTSSYTATLASADNPRHVNWDELGDEEEESNEDDARLAQIQREQQQRQWNSRVQQHQASLNAFWGDNNHDDSPDEDAISEPPEETEPLRLHWTEYLMPPYDKDRTCLNLPLSSESHHIVNEWNCYQAAKTAGANIPVFSEWVEDQVWERLRRMLEACDSCQGLMVLTSGRGVYAGLTSYLLQEFQDECPSARKVVMPVEELEPEQQKHDGTSEQDKSADSWHVQQVQRLRSRVETGLFYHDALEAADGVIPLKIPSGDRFVASARVAASLEAASLSLRVASNPSAPVRIGLNSHYYGSMQGDSPFGWAPYTNLSELVNSMKPTGKHSLWELDSALPSEDVNHGKCWNAFLEGTTLQRDRRMRESRQMSGSRRPQDEEPGAWLLDKGKGGVLSCLSAESGGNRQLHSHFGFAASVRTAPPPSNSPTEYINCIMQGMGIRFRPEQATATVAFQGIGELTQDGYGAGSYWNTVWPSASPVVSVLGNSTRSYQHIDEISKGFRQSLSRQAMGYFNRDVMSGLLPERDDCEEAFSSCLELVDVYRPPDSSGLTEDESGIDY